MFTRCEIQINIIFLDIDGVLNGAFSFSQCHNWVGIDKDKVQRLVKIVDYTNAKLVLISTWKLGWEPFGRYDRRDPKLHHAKYLDNHLMKKGKLRCIDKTREKNSLYRGAGIREWLNRHPDVENWVVLDDEIFMDYQENGIINHLVCVDSCYGLTDEDVENAICVLTGQKQDYTKNSGKCAAALNVTDCELKETSHGTN